MCELYSNLLKQGWTMNDIDSMDILYYFEVMAYQPKEQKQYGYIDQVI